MSRIDLGICFYGRSVDFESFDSTIKLLLKEVFQGEDVKFKTVYLFDREEAKVYSASSIKEALMILRDKNICNRFDFLIGDNVFYIQIEKDQTGDINLSLDIRYESASDIFDMSECGDITLKIKEGLNSFYKKNKFRYAFADLEAEFDFNYDELKELIAKNESPYALLIMDLNDKAQTFHSEYDAISIN